MLVDSSSIHLVAYPGLEVDLWQLDANVTRAARARVAGDLATRSRALSAIVAALARRASDRPRQR